MTLHAYLPQDRLRALARGETLPDHANGAALFADIAGFTPLTEALHNTLGPRRGAEALSQQLERVYSALIAEIERHGGSVISFAGDSMLCWFDAPGAEQVAVGCALALQEAMQAFVNITLPDKSTTTLTLKVAVASGPARRFVVGDPTIQLMDTLAGATIARTAMGEHLASKGEVLVDEATASTLNEVLTLNEWRTDSESGERFALVDSVDIEGKPAIERIARESIALDSTLLRPFIHPAVYERERSQEGSFLTEFRPCVTLFVRFTGIDYDTETAEAQLDDFIRQTQVIVMQHDGTFLQLTIGDKGSYAHINFGMLTTYEDDARRAVKSALALQAASTLALQMGIAQGVIRVGAYGGPTRITFNALGDDVNLAARLMTNVQMGEILVSESVQKAVEAYVVCEPRLPLLVKGKTEPVSVFVVTGERKQRAIRLQEPNYALPMVGRQSELQRISEKLDLAAAGKAQVVGIIAEAGLGKSRLVAEVIRLAHTKGFVGYGGACQSDGVNTPYLAWKAIWSAFFNVDPSAPLKKQVRLLEGELEDRSPSRVQALPLLNIVLDLNIPDNDFTRSLEPQNRKSVLTALFEECLRSAVQDEALLIVIEDMHWIDALSHDLLEELVKLLADCPICFVLAYRPPQITRLVVPRLESLPQFTKIELHELNRAEAEQAILAKLAQLFPVRSRAVPVMLVDKLMARAQGNPFYLEELLNYLRDRGLDPRDPVTMERIELPDSLHTLVLSRIDQLSERGKTTLRVASIIGRLFRAAWLAGYYPALGDVGYIKVELDKLHTLDITPLDAPEPELAYLFKHIVLHEVTYESLPFATRAQLHEQLAAYLEQQIAEGALHEAPLLDTLTFHYTHTDNYEKQRVYLQKAAEAALAVSAFNTALEYLTRLLELTPVNDPARSALALQLAEAHFRLGDYPATRVAIEQAQVAAQTDADRASALALLGEMTNNSGKYAEAQTILEQVVPLARASGDGLTLCRTLSALGVNYWRLGKLDDARAVQEESLTLARTLGDVPRELFALIRLGTVVGAQGDLDAKERLLMEVYTRATATGNRERARVALNNLGTVASERKDYVTARDYHQQSLALAREIGAQHSIALALINLASANSQIGELSTARAGLCEGLALALRLGSQPWVVLAIVYFSDLAHTEGQTERALALLGLARRQPAWSSDHEYEFELALAEWALDPAVVEAGLAKGAKMNWEDTIQELLEMDSMRFS